MQLSTPETIRILLASIAQPVRGSQLLLKPLHQKWVQFVGLLTPEIAARPAGNVGRRLHPPRALAPVGIARAPDPQTPGRSAATARQSQQSSGSGRSEDLSLKRPGTHNGPEGFRLLP